MQVTTLPYADVPQLPTLFKQYISGVEALKPFYVHQPSLEGLKAAIATQQPVDRQLLVTVIDEQYKAFQLTAPNYELLAGENCLTVCTGHQLCLFTGPLYFIYKIVTTIKLANDLKAAHPDKDFVPIYWMASEDHDFKEVNHAHLFGKNVKWQTSQGGAVGRMKLGDLQPALEEALNIIGEGEKAHELRVLLQEAYSQPTLAAATRLLVHMLFGRHGLIVLDADDARLKASFADVLKDDMIQHNAHGLVNETNKELEELGYKPQVNPREINSFLLGDGSRERIEDTRLAQRVDAEPQNFSPNVILRPLYQQRILPNIAYIGGPGEIAYWLQLESTFKHYDIPFPVLLPRNFALYIDKKQGEKLRAMAIPATELFGDVQQLMSKLVEDESEIELSLVNEKKEVGAVFEMLKKRALEIDKSLEGAVNAEEHKLQKALEALEKKMLKAEKRKYEGTIDQLDTLHQRLFPNGGLQERYDNFIPFYLQYGQAWIDGMIEHFDPLSKEFYILLEE